jgi:phosphoglycolate phosphatase
LQKNYKFILFDLDGTLSDPKIGITKSVQFALDRMGIIDR